MFTGLIEEVGQVLSVDQSAAGSRIAVGAKMILADARQGDSIAVDGVCTTVVALTNESFCFEASPETLSKTTLAGCEVGTRVNLERPLKPTDRLGGHFVTGHVDGTALVISKIQDGLSWVYHFRVANPELAALLIPKGSVAVNGISLTVNEVQGNVFSVAIIPHTHAHTNIGDIEPDDRVNIEMDLLGKYVQRLLPGMHQGVSSDVAGGPAINDPVKQLGNTRIHTGAWFNLDSQRPESTKSDPASVQ